MCVLVFMHGVCGRMDEFVLSRDRANYHSYQKAKN